MEFTSRAEGRSEPAKPAVPVESERAVCAARLLSGCELNFQQCISYGAESAHFRHPKNISRPARGCPAAPSIRAKPLKRRSMRCEERACAPIAVQGEREGVGSGFADVRGRLTE